MATSSEQKPLRAFAAGTTTESVTQTAVIPLETSQRKNQRVKTAIEEFQEICSYLVDVIPSFDIQDRSPNNATLYRLVTREFPKEDRTIGSRVAQSAIRHVTAAFKSKLACGDGGGRPTFGDGDYFMLNNKTFDIVENSRGYGLKARFIPHKPEWFHINPRPHTKNYLDRAVGGSGSIGTGEFRLSDVGDLAFHLPVSWDVEVYEPTDVKKTIGVDIGEKVIYAAAVVAPDGVESVEMKTGGEFRHYRQQLEKKRTRLAEQSDLHRLKKTRGEQRRYTQQVLDTASREIVDLAVEHAPAKLRLEDLTHYRETADNPIHDWPFALLQEKIAYKAKAEGIPVETVNPRNTSVTCRKCGQTNREYRNGDEFACTRCGYEVHADVNAAINIAEWE